MQKKKSEEKLEEATEDPGNFSRVAKFRRVTKFRRAVNFCIEKLLRSQFLTFCLLFLFSSQIIPL